MNSPSEDLQEFYDQMWRESAPLVRTGKVEVDPVLEANANDARRGITLLAQPDGELQGRITDFLAALRLVDDRQYYYRPEQMHMTVLSLFTATKDHERFDALLPGYLNAVQEALQGVRPFRVCFKGITASRGAVLIQGFPQDGTLEELRGRLRSVLAVAGLADGLDGRYRIITAHMTVLRFRAALRRSEGFYETLASYRAADFGILNVSKLSLIKHDWFVSAESKEVLGEFPLPFSAK